MVRKFSLILFVLSIMTTCALTLSGCAAAALVAGIGYASSSADEADAKMIQARADWEKMNVERHKAGLAPLPYPGDDQLEQMSPEDRARGREAWEKMNEKRASEGKDQLTMPDAYRNPASNAHGDPVKPNVSAPDAHGSKR